MTAAEPTPGDRTSGEPTAIGTRGPRSATSSRVADLLAAMTLDERIGQITQVDRTAISPDEVAKLGIGSILSGGGGNPDPNTPTTWRAMVDEYVDASRRSRLGIPILYGTDAVHGHSNVVGATIFPHNIGLGAAGDADLVRAIGRATALETAATGSRWTFAPTVAVPQDPRWGRTYEGYGQHPDLVAPLGAALVDGLQGDGPGIDVLACAKHFIADGGTTWGTTGGAEWSPWWVRSYGNPTWRMDQGDARLDEATLRAVHLPPYRVAVEQGVGTVMASYSSWNGEKVHAHHFLLTEVLKGELGFAGFVVTDYLAVDQVSPDYREAVVRCLTAGIDMVMVPFDHARFRAAVRTAVEAGELPIERLDDAVRRILTVKAAMGLLDDEPPALPDPAILGCDEHRALARGAAADGVVVLADEAGVLPLATGTGADATVLVAGAAADDVGLACGGWTIEWCGAAGPITPGSTLVEGLRDHLGARVVVTGATAEDPSPLEGLQAGIGVVTVHEAPYAEGMGDREQLALEPEQVELVRRVAARTDRTVLIVISGRPLVLSEVERDVDAIVAAWWPGSEAAGVADVLVGARPVVGTLPLDWPAEDRTTPEATQPPAIRWPRGYGLRPGTRAAIG
jgi:beta-glucosidase